MRRYSQHQHPQHCSTASRIAAAAHFLVAASTAGAHQQSVNTLSSSLNSHAQPQQRRAFSSASGPLLFRQQQQAVVANAAVDVGANNARGGGDDDALASPVAHFILESIAFGMTKIAVSEYETHCAPHLLSAAATETPTETTNVLGEAEGLGAGGAAALPLLEAAAVGEMLAAQIANKITHSNTSAGDRKNTTVASDTDNAGALVLLKDCLGRVEATLASVNARLGHLNSNTRTRNTTTSADADSAKGRQLSSTTRHHSNSNNNDGKPLPPPASSVRLADASRSSPSSSSLSGGDGTAVSMRPSAVTDVASLHAMLDHTLQQLTEATRQWKVYERLCGGAGNLKRQQQKASSSSAPTGNGKRNWQARQQQQQRNLSPSGVRASSAEEDEAVLTLLGSVSGNNSSILLDQVLGRGDAPAGGTEGEDDALLLLPFGALPSSQQSIRQQMVSLLSPTAGETKAGVGGESGSLSPSSSLSSSPELLLLQFHKAQHEALQTRCPLVLVDLRWAWLDALEAYVKLFHRHNDGGDGAQHHQSSSSSSNIPPHPTAVAVGHHPLPITFAKLIRICSFVVPAPPRVTLPHELRLGGKGAVEGGEGGDDSGHMENSKETLFVDVAARSARWAEEAAHDAAVAEEAMRRIRSIVALMDHTSSTSSHIHGSNTTNEEDANSTSRMNASTASQTKTTGCSAEPHHHQLAGARRAEEEPIPIPSFDYVRNFDTVGLSWQQELSLAAKGKSTTEATNASGEAVKGGCDAAAAAHMALLEEHLKGHHNQKRKQHGASQKPPATTNSSNSNKAAAGRGQHGDDKEEEEGEGRRRRVFAVVPPRGSTRPMLEIKLNEARHTLTARHGLCQQHFHAWTRHLKGEERSSVEHSAAVDAAAKRNTSASTVVDAAFLNRQPPPFIPLSPLLFPPSLCALALEGRGTHPRSQDTEEGVGGGAAAVAQQGQGEEQLPQRYTVNADGSVTVSMMNMNSATASSSSSSSSSPSPSPAIISWSALLPLDWWASPEDRCLRLLQDYCARWEAVAARCSSHHVERSDDGAHTHNGTPHTHDGGIGGGVFTAKAVDQHSTVVAATAATASSSSSTTSPSPSSAAEGGDAPSPSNCCSYELLEPLRGPSALLEVVGGGTGRGAAMGLRAEGASSPVADVDGDGDHDLVGQMLDAFAVTRRVAHTASLLNGCADVNISALLKFRPTKGLILAVAEAANALGSAKLGRVVLEGRVFRGRLLLPPQPQHQHQRSPSSPIDGLSSSSSSPTAPSATIIPWYDVNALEFLDKLEWASNVHLDRVLRAEESERQSEHSKRIEAQQSKQQRSDRSNAALRRSHTTHNTSMIPPPPALEDIMTATVKTRQLFPAAVRLAAVALGSRHQWQPVVKAVQAMQHSVGLDTPMAAATTPFAEVLSGPTLSSSSSPTTTEPSPPPQQQSAVGVEDATNTTRTANNEPHHTTNSEYHQLYDSLGAAQTMLHLATCGYLAAVITAGDGFYRKGLVKQLGAIKDTLREVAGANAATTSSHCYSSSSSSSTASAASPSSANHQQQRDDADERIIAAALGDKDGGEKSNDKRNKRAVNKKQRNRFDFSEELGGEEGLIGHGRHLLVQREWNKNGGVSGDDGNDGERVTVDYLLAFVQSLERKLTLVRKLGAASGAPHAAAAHPHPPLPSAAIGANAPSSSASPPPPPSLNDCYRVLALCVTQLAEGCEAMRRRADLIRAELVAMTADDGVATTTTAAASSLQQGGGGDDASGHQNSNAALFEKLLSVKQSNPFNNNRNNNNSHHRWGATNRINQSSAGASSSSTSSNAPLSLQTAISPISFWRIGLRVISDSACFNPHAAVVAAVTALRVSGHWGPSLKLAASWYHPSLPLPAAHPIHSSPSSSPSAPASELSFIVSDPAGVAPRCPVLEAFILLGGSSDGGGHVGGGRGGGGPADHHHHHYANVSSPPAAVIYERLGLPRIRSQTGPSSLVSSPPSSPALWVGLNVDAQMTVASMLLHEESYGWVPPTLVRRLRLWFTSRSLHHEGGGRGHHHDHSAAANRGGGSRSMRSIISEADVMQSSSTFTDESVLLQQNSLTTHHHHRSMDGGWGFDDHTTGSGGGDRRQNHGGDADGNSGRHRADNENGTSSNNGNNSSSSSRRRNNNAPPPPFGTRDGVVRFKERRQWRTTNDMLFENNNNNNHHGARGRGGGGWGSSSRKGGGGGGRMMQWGGGGGGGGRDTHPSSYTHVGEEGEPQIAFGGNAPYHHDADRSNHNYDVHNDQELIVGGASSFSSRRGGVHQQQQLRQFPRSDDASYHRQRSSSSSQRGASNRERHHYNGDSSANASASSREGEDGRLSGGYQRSGKDRYKAW